MATTNITAMKKAIEKLSKWEKTDYAFGYIKTDGGKKADYIYEFFCAMKILNDLSKNHKISIDQGNYGYTFPKKPSKKVNYAKFIIEDKGSPGKKLFQVTLGTEISISTSPKTTYSADISFQLQNAPDDPDDSHVVLIMDTKYKSDQLTKLEISLIREFAKCVQDMGAPKSARSKLMFNKMVDLNANCLITNGETADDHEKYCKNNNVLQVGLFDWNSNKYKTIG